MPLLANPLLVAASLSIGGLTKMNTVPGPMSQWPATNAHQAPEAFSLPTIFNTAEMPIDANEPARFASLGIGTKDQFLLRWQSAQTSLAIAKDNELLLRLACAKILTRESTKQEGVVNVELGNDYTAKVGLKKNYKLKSFDEKVNTLDAVDAIADKMAEVGNEGSFIAERLFKWSVDLSLSEYRKLEEESKTSADAKKMFDLVNSVLEISDATPTLEIKEPKAKK